MEQALKYVGGKPKDVVESQAAHGFFLVGKWSIEL